MRDKQAKSVALGGMLAALALVIMCLGGLIPVATYVCPVLCIILLSFVLQLCGRRLAWAWYAAVMLLCLFMAPDKEAAVIFAFLGYYPMVKTKLDKWPVSWLWKLFLFNVMIFLAYSVLIYLLGIDQVVSEYRQLGFWLTAITLFLGNLCLFLLDRVLSNLQYKFRSKYKNRNSYVVYK